jgi:protein tyrosine phosphatase
MIVFISNKKQTLYQVELNYDQQVHLLLVHHLYFVDWVQIQVVEMVKELVEVLDELM